MMADSTDSVAYQVAPIEYIPNPDFSFPAQPDPSRLPSQHHGPRRAASLHLSSKPPITPQRISGLDTRSASTLPTFSFNAADTSGRAASPAADSDLMDFTPSLSARSYGHRRGASEFIGGNGKHGGAADLIAVSPLKPVDGLGMPATTATAAALGSPVRKRGHAHRRSAAISSHDVSSILQPRDANIMSSQDSEAPPQPLLSAQDPLIASSQQQAPPPPPSFPVGRPRVGFSSNIEIIPRPLSTISSEAESIASGTGAQSPSSSATSPRQSGAFSPTNKRKSRSARSSLSEVEFASHLRSSLEDRFGMEQDEDSNENNKDGLTHIEEDFERTNGSQKQTVVWPLNKPAFNLDRRCSEPSLSYGTLQKPRRSSVSLREPLTSPESITPEPEVLTAGVKRKSSASRVKAWANSMMNRKERKGAKRPSRIEFDPAKPDEISPPAQDDCTPMSEADLEELFSQDPFSQPDGDQDRTMDLGSRMNMESLKDFNPTFGDSNDTDLMIDLDAAMNSSQTPSRDGKSPGFGARRQLHSSRMNRDFNSPGNIYHRRAESAPVLTPFDYGKSASPMHSPMADVFEEEEEDENAKTGPSPPRGAAPQFSFPQGPIETGSPLSQDDGLGIRNDASATPATPTATSMLPDGPGVSPTDTSEVGPLEIVEAHEEPRASTMTKSSDSSDTATLPADPNVTLAPQQTNISNFMTPSTLGGSAFSTPDVSRRQTSFDMPRLGTSASSAAECRTLSSFASERPETRPSVDDVPSLTSSRSTMISSMHLSKRDISDRPSSTRSRQLSAEQQEQRRRKRSSIQSLTKLMSGPFGESKNKISLEHGNASSPDLISGKHAGRKKEKRMSKLMFWKGKSSRTEETRG
ncbi:hypothetical protein K461DRAFT_167075 [Myriangium duriaei CBS 260.36]|uniref:Cell wall proline rich protein n=1 Tax=Myriangium duriaei CBS 260.36 TaxID=1168546 RepID=A0A9P4IYQ0_9PEZI|nr:hypothetical protein K461DRAFT_167075 [Myriangium duriaei CBS 260.36]